MQGKYSFIPQKWVVFGKKLLKRELQISYKLKLSQQIQVSNNIFLIFTSCYLSQTKNVNIPLLLLSSEMEKF